MLIRNKPGRAEAIDQLIASILKARILGFKDALSLRGKLTYAEGQTHGRLAAPASRLLSQWAKIRMDRALSEDLALALQGVGPALVRAPPKTVGPASLRPPIVIFTDGACEPEGSSIGGVLFDGDLIECFGALLEQTLVDTWKTRLDQEQVIGQAELFPVLVARHTWADKVEGRRVIFFIDNDSARLALIKSYSPVLPSLRIVMECVAFDFASGLVPWYARVPTESNISDDPSRLCSKTLIELYEARIVAPVFPPGSRPAWCLE